MDLRHRPGPAGVPTVTVSTLDSGRGTQFFTYYKLYSSSSIKVMSELEEERRHMLHTELRQGDLPVENTSKKRKRESLLVQAVEQDDLQKAESLLRRKRTNVNPQRGSSLFSLLRVRVATKLYDCLSKPTQIYRTKTMERRRSYCLREWISRGCEDPR